MARPLRLCVPGYPLHIVQRGHDRCPCFFEDAERELYLGLLGTYARRSGCDVHAYVLMTNHVHLLITPGSVPAASLLMKEVGQRFVQYMNRKYARVGSLWQGRYHSSVVDSDTYFLTCQRYIEANPVRAGMVSHASHYAWSSFAHNGCGAPSALLTPHPTYLALGTDPERRCAAYRSACGADLDSGVLARIRTAIKSGLPFGSEHFVREIASRTGVAIGRRKPGPVPRQKPANRASDVSGDEIGV